MVSTCLVCGKHADARCERGLHRFPKDSDLRQRWIDILGQETFDFIDDTKTEYRICTEHFDINDIRRKPSGIIYLRKGAVPLILSEVKDEPQPGPSTEETYFSPQLSEGLLRLKEEPQPETSIDEMYFVAPLPEMIKDEPEPWPGPHEEQFSPLLLDRIKEEPQPESSTEEINLSPSLSDRVKEEPQPEPSAKEIRLPPTLDWIKDEPQPGSSSQKLYRLSPLPESFIKSEKDMLSEPNTEETHVSSASPNRIEYEPQPGPSDYEAYPLSPSPERAIDTASENSLDSDSTLTASDNDLEMLSTSSSGDESHKVAQDHCYARKSNDDVCSLDEKLQSSKTTCIDKLRFKKPRYVGDIKNEDLDSPEKALQAWEVCKKTLEIQKKKIKSLTITKKRLKDEVYELKTIIKKLKGFKSNQG